MYSCSDEAEWEPGKPETWNRTHEREMVKDLLAVVDDFRADKPDRDAAKELIAKVEAAAVASAGPDRMTPPRPAPTGIPGPGRAGG